MRRPPRGHSSPGFPLVPAGVPFSGVAAIFFGSAFGSPSEVGAVDSHQQACPRISPAAGCKLHPRRPSLARSRACVEHLEQGDVSIVNVRPHGARPAATSSIADGARPTQRYPSRRHQPEGRIRRTPRDSSAHWASPSRLSAPMVRGASRSTGASMACLKPSSSMAPASSASNGSDR